jgi:hypothetical protein
MKAAGVSTPISDTYLYKHYSSLQSTQVLTMKNESKLVSAALQPMVSVTPVTNSYAIWCLGHMAFGG